MSIGSALSSIGSGIASGASAVFNSSQMQNLGAGVTGNIVKAVLCIRNPKNLDDVSMNVPQKNDLSPTEKASIQDVVTLNAALMEKAEASLAGGKASTFDDIKDVANDNGYICLEVQYNPNTIRLDTTAGRQVNYKGEHADVDVQRYIAPASTTLSCELLFDDVNNMDAFMIGDNPITGLSVGNVKNAIASAGKGKYSVQTQMEGLLSLLTISQARHVIFFWGDMCFRGEMTQVTTSYTMFNKKGYPIRGKVGIQIRQGDGTSEATGLDALYAYDESHWQKAFDATFTENGDSQSDWRGYTNNSLLNLNL